MSTFLQITVVVFIYNIYSCSTDSPLCDNSNPCSNTIVECNANEACDVTCNQEKCQNTVIECPENHLCTVSCNGWFTCDEARINASFASELTLTCTGTDTCANMIIYCPPNIGGTKKCSITANGNLFGNFDNGLEFYAINGWNDLHIAYSGSYWGKTHQQTMYCTKGYWESCRIPEDAWRCESPTDICTNPPLPTTTIPTTSIPTTSIPTTNMPSTPKPITASPTTTNPTTPIPTTTNPTTSNPTTMQPTTMFPTTSNPTTNNPTILSTKMNTITSTTPKTTVIDAHTTNKQTKQASYTSTEFRQKHGEINDQSTTFDSVGSKIQSNESSDSYYILYILASVAVILIIFVIICGVLLLKRKKSVQHKNDISTDINTNNVSTNANTNAYYVNALDKSPMSSINGTCFFDNINNTNNTNNNQAENIGEIQLTPTSYNDDANDDIDGMYTNVVTDNGNNNITKGGETMNGENNMNNNNIINVMKDMDDIDDLFDKPTVNITTPGHMATKGNM